MRLYLDANPIIYSIEGVPAFRQASLDWIERAEAADAYEQAALGPNLLRGMSDHRPVEIGGVGVESRPVSAEDQFRDRRGPTGPA